MSSPLIIFLLLIVAVGSFFFGRWHGMSQRTKALSEELKAKDDELNTLKEDVNKHFDETARLFSNFTEEYKMLYQHLASSSSKLSNRKFELKLSSNTGTLAGLSSPLEKELNADVIDSEAKEIADYDSGPQQPRDYADDDMDDDYHPAHSTETIKENVSDKDQSKETGNSQPESESELNEETDDKTTKDKLHPN